MGLHYSIDGNQVCAVGHHFRNLQEDNAGFGDSPKAAFIDYYRVVGGDKPKAADCHPWEIDWIEEI